VTAGAWWDGYFDETFVDIYRDFLTPERTAREVEALRALVPLGPGDRVLDLACGWGRHAVELARGGCEVTALDWSPDLLERARRRAEAAGVEVEWVRGDMRELAWEERFDAALCLYSSLGFFLSDEDDLRVLRGARRALRPGGALVIETMHRDQVVREFVERDWWETASGGVVRVEREFDALEGVTREWTTWSRGDRTVEKRHAVRVRSATEWDGLLRAAGLLPREWWGDWSCAPFLHASEALIVVAERPR
jgi:ubiquinone/menaquinone biosynthesis C-methylase UbiE